MMILKRIPVTLTSNKSYSENKNTWIPQINIQMHSHVSKCRKNTKKSEKLLKKINLIDIKVKELKT